MEPKKYEYIDSLRGIAILLVLIVHTWMYNLEIVSFLPDFVTRFMGNGKFGVQLFFIVSAFTLTISWHNRIGEKRALTNFFIRRFFRIAPIYYLAIIYFTFSLFMKFDIANYDWSEFPFKGFVSSILFVHSLFPSWVNSYVPGGWSISVEFIFYFSLPFICKYVTNINRSFIFLMVTLLFATILNYILTDSSFDKYHYLYYYFPNQLPIFALGVFAYWIINQGIGNIKTVSAFLLILVLWVFNYLPMPEQLLHSLAFFVLLLILSKHQYKLLSNKILATIGKYSFSMYIIHFALLNLLDSESKQIISVYNTPTALVDLFLFYIVLVAVTFVVSHFTYTYIEVAGQNLGRKLIKKLNQ